MTPSAPDEDDPLYLGRNLEQWWADFLSADYVDGMDLLCKALVTNFRNGVIWDFCASQRIDEKNTNFVCQALPCFGEAFIQKAIAALPSVDPQRQARLVFCIGSTGPQSVPCLVKLLKHPSANVRAAACMGLNNTYWELGRRRSPIVLQMMIEFLQGPRLSQEKLNAFFDEFEAEPVSVEDRSTVNVEVVAALIERLEDDYQAVRLAAIEILGPLLRGPYIIEDSSRSDIVAALVKTLEDDRRAVRLAAMEVLASLGCQEAHLAEQDVRLYDAIHNYNDLTAYEKAESELQFNAVLEHLQSLLDDPDPDVREHVGRTLAICKSAAGVQSNLSRRDAIKLLQAVEGAAPASGRDAAVRQEAIYVLQWLTEQWEYDVHDKAEPERTEIEPCPILWMQAETDRLAKTSIDKAIAALHDRDIAVRLAAVDALVEISSTGKDVLSHVLDMFRDPSEPVRWRAQRALNLMVRNKSEAWERYGLNGPPRRPSSVT